MQEIDIILNENTERTEKEIQKKPEKRYTPEIKETFH